MNRDQQAPAPVALRYQIFRWLLTVCWAGLIFDLSSKSFGSSFTAVMLHRLLALVHIRLSPQNFETLHFAVRKSAHFTEYAIFALLIYISISRLARLEWRPRAALWSMVIAGVYSLSDEFHQMFVPNRGPSLKDSALDTAGAVVAITLIYLGNRRAAAPPRTADAGIAGAGAPNGGVHASSGDCRKLEDVQDDG